MHQQILLTRLVTKELARCQGLYDELKALETTLPEGSLFQRGKNIYHSYRENGVQSQKVAHSKRLIEDLKMRQFLRNGLPYLESRIAACKAFLKKNSIYDPVHVLTSMPQVYDRIKDYNIFLEGDINPDSWIQEAHQRNTLPFSTDHYTEQGVPVRSKAEAMIGTQIEKRNWLFICEPRMSFGSEIKCPDFAILLPKTRQIIYLEHFGRMGDPGYVKDTMEKLILYRQHGLHLGVNFFFTWESLAKPLTYAEIEATLDEIMARDK